VTHAETEQKEKTKRRTEGQRRKKTTSPEEAEKRIRKK
jgi:hypothetical protein